MCNLFSTPSVPSFVPAPAPIMEQQGTGEEEANMDKERRRAAARQGFESTWLGKSKLGAFGGGQSAAPAAPQAPQTVLRKNMGA